MKKYTKDTELNDMLNNVAEISLSYNYKYRHVDTYDITCGDCEEALEIVKEYA